MPDRPFFVGLVPAVHGPPPGDVDRRRIGAVDMALTALAGGRLLAEVPPEGDGPRRLYLHGWGRTRRDFAAIAERRPGIVVDLPGFGSSPPPTSRIGSLGYAEIVADGLDEVLPATASILAVGHSFGGRVALQLACLRPERVGALLL
jgi:pimeloyl-ACP methyl ester carboxylesterase